MTSRRSLRRSLPRRSARFRRRLQSTLSVAVFLAGLEGAIRLTWPHDRIILPPSTILAGVGGALQDGILLHLLATLQRTLVGFVIASILGIVIGVAIGRNLFLRSVLLPFVDFLRPLPSSAIIPAAILFSGLEERTYIVVIVFGAIWPILIGAFDGTAKRHPTAEGVMAQLHLSWLSRLRNFILPEAGPEIYTGMKISISIALILAVTAEMLVGRARGLGQFINHLETGGDYRNMYLGILLIAVVGFLINTVFQKLESRIPWLLNQAEVQQELRGVEG